MSDDSKTPIEAEAAGDETAVVEWQGITFEVPRNRGDWSLDAELAARADDPIAFVQAMVSPEAFADLRAKQPRNKDVADLGAKIVAALGFSDSGESPASSD